MSSTTLNSPFTPVVADSAILPLTSRNELAPPFDVSASYSNSSEILTVNVSVLLPKEVSIDTVTLGQYYSTTAPTQLQYYFVYKLQGEEKGDFVEIPCCFEALVPIVDGTPVPLAQITEVFLLICDSDPKTSRGTVTTVVPTN